MAVRFFPAETIPPRLSLRPVSSLAAIQFRISGLFRLDLSRSGRQVAGILGLLFAVGGPTLFAAEPARPKAATLPDTTDISFRNELQHAIDKGLAWLEKNQDTNGFWSTADQPAFTALALTAFQGEPTGRYRRIETPGLKKGYAFLLRNLKPDGGIYHTNLVTYNTSLSMMALLAAQRPEYDAPLRQARQFLIGLQKDFGEPGKLDTPFDGGIGYGSRYKHSDMGNTLAALEALHYSQHLAADTKLAGARELDYSAAIHFLQACQNLPAYNKESWASDDPRQQGGFVYYPGQSMAGNVTNSATGRVALRSYGSISYGGMLSYLYADLPRTDPRVQAVYDWLRANYTLEENPGLGQQGLYFYLHTLTKALTFYGANELTLPDGRKINWRKETGLKLLNLQQRDGSWANTQNRWMEKDPVLATAYAVIALELIYRGL